MNDRNFKAGADGQWPGTTLEILRVTRETEIPASQTNFEVGSIALPTGQDWQLVEASVWARSVTSDPTVNLQDDGVDITDLVDIVQLVQTPITFTGPVRLKGGSELQVLVDTDSGDAVTDVQVTIVIRPYPLGEAAVAVT